MASSDYKKFNREIKGYVEISYDIGYFDARFPFYIDSSGIRQTLAKKDYSENFTSIANSNKNKSEYAILYNNLTKLDGTFMLFNKSSNNCGYIAEKTPKEVYEEYHTSGVANSGKIGFYLLKVGHSAGITIYTRNNVIKNATINIEYFTEGVQKNETKEIINNKDDILLIELDNTQDSSQIVLIVNEWENDEKYINIVSVDSSLSYIYKDEELIEFNVTEEVNKLVEETPSNELKVTIGDYKHLYDPLNPKGIAKYLKEDISTFVPYIGIVTESGSIEYTKLGKFYFKNIEYNNKEVTFTAYNLMEKLNKKLITNDTGNLTTESNIIPINGLSSYLNNYMTTEVQMPFDININNKIRMNTKALKRVSLPEFFQQISMIDGIFYIDRNDKIIIKNIDKTIKESITKQELLNDIKYTNVQKVTSFNLQRDNFTMGETTEANETANFTSTFKLESETQFFCITSDDPTVLSWLTNENLTVTGATSYNIITKTSKNEFNFMLFVKVIGNKGDEVTISGKYPYRKDYSMSTETELIGTGEPSMTIDNPLYMIKYYAYDDMFTNFFKKAYSYKVSLEYNGNPEIKAGDYIEVESNYGVVPIFIQKHTLKYNGGLSGSIEGVE